MASPPLGWAGECSANPGPERMNSLPQNTLNLQAPIIDPYSDPGRFRFPPIVEFVPFPFPAGPYLFPSLGP